MNPTSVKDAQEMSQITCVTDEKRHRVYVQSVLVCSGTTPACGNTCASGAGTHGDVLNLRTEGFFCVPSRATHHTTQNTHTHTPHKPRTPARHNTRRQRDRDRGRQRQRQRKKTGTEREEKTEEERQDKRREDKRRQDKRREKIHFQCGGAWPFFVDVVIFWLIPFAHET